MARQRSQHLLSYTDESGRLGKDNLFFFGTLWCDRLTARHMRHVIAQVRACSGFNDTMHFSELSNLRAKMYVEVAQTLATIPGWSMGVLVYRRTFDANGKPYNFSHYGQRRDPVELKRARAYNKLLRDHLSAIIRYHPMSFWTMYIEDRNRPRDDNGKQYIRGAIESYYIKEVAFIPKRHDDLLQFTDVLLGAYAHQAYQQRCGVRPSNPPGPRKIMVADEVMKAVGRRFKAPWIWTPQ